MNRVRTLLLAVLSGCPGPLPTSLIRSDVPPTTIHLELPEHRVHITGSTVDGDLLWWTLPDPETEHRLAVIGRYDPQVAEELWSRESIGGHIPAGWLRLPQDARVVGRTACPGPGRCLDVRSDRRQLLVAPDGTVRREAFPAAGASLLVEYRDFAPTGDLLSAPMTWETRRFEQSMTLRFQPAAPRTPPPIDFRHRGADALASHVLPVPETRVARSLSGGALEQDLVRALRVFRSLGLELGDAVELSTGRPLPDPTSARRAEAIRALLMGLGIPARTGTDATTDLVAFVDPAGVIRVVDPRQVSVSTLVHELAHVRRVRLGLPRRAASIEALQVLRAISEGEAELVESEARAREAGLSLDTLDPGTLRALHRRWPEASRNQPWYAAGASWLYPAFHRRGWAGLDAAWRAAPPASSEIVLHPEKTDRDIPTSVPDVPTGHRVTTSEVLGELCIGRLFAIGRTPREALRLAAGWDGDRLMVVEDDAGIPGLLWRTVWDRDEDAVAVAEALRSVPRQMPIRVRHEGRVVDFVASPDLDLATSLADAAAEAPFTPPDDPEGAATTALIEERLTVPLMIVDEDNWRHTGGLVELRLPTDWSLGEAPGPRQIGVSPLLAPGASDGSDLARLLELDGWGGARPITVDGQPAALFVSDDVTVISVLVERDIATLLVAEQPAPPALAGRIRVLTAP